MAYDNACKALAERYPEAVLRWLLPEFAGTVQLLKTELNREPLRADSIILLQTRETIVHLEFQTLPESTPPLPLRMLDYATTLKRLYGKPVVQVVVFLKETKDEQVFVNCYQDSSTTHHYRVLRLWEQPPEILLAVPALLPFATLAQTDTPRELLQAIVNQVATIEDTSERREITSFAEILAGLRFPKALIYQLLREDVMQESVIYQDILQKGEARGTQKGIQQGLRQGLQQGLQQGKRQGLRQGKRQEAAALVLRLLTRKVGLLEPELHKRIQRLSLTRLEALGEALLDFATIDDLLRWLEQQPRRKRKQPTE